MKAQAPIVKFDAWRRRTLLGIAIGCLAIGTMLQLRATSASDEFVPGVLLKVGIVLFMGWLALPQLQKLNPWLLAPVATLGLLAIVQPRTLPVIARAAIPLLPIAFLIWLFWAPKR